MSCAAKFPASRLVITGARELKLRLADRARQNLDRIVGAIEGERVDGVGAGDAKMNRDSGRNEHAVRDKQVLLRDHAHRDRAIRILLGSKIILDEFSCQVKRQWFDMGSLQKTQKGNVDLIVAGGRDQAQN